MKKNYFTSGLPKIITKTVYLLLVMSFLISISSYSQITKTFTSSGTLEVPAGVTTLSVQTWGAGGVTDADGAGSGGKGGDGLLVLNLDNGNGVTGGFPGGGGGGSAMVLDLLGLFGNPIGGKGGDGQMKVTYTCPTYSITEISADNVCVISGTKVVTLKGFYL